MTCFEGNYRIIDQILLLIESLNADQYTQTLTLFENSSLGKHFRHIHDFYECFLKADSNVDYTKRARNQTIETEPKQAIFAFRVIQKRLESITSKTITVLGDFDKHELDRTIIQSSTERELMFLHDHAVHHLAIIKMGIKFAFPELKVPEEVGVAPATLSYEATTKQ